MPVSGLFFLPLSCCSHLPWQLWAGCGHRCTSSKDVIFTKSGVKPSWKAKLAGNFSWIKQVFPSILFFFPCELFPSFYRGSSRAVKFCPGSSLVPSADAIPTPRCVTRPRRPRCWMLIFYFCIPWLQMNSSPAGRATRRRAPSGPWGLFMSCWALCVVTAS